MPGPLLDYKSDPLFDPLFAQLQAEMDAGDTTDLRPWMTRAAEIATELAPRFGGERDGSAIPNKRDNPPIARLRVGAFSRGGLHAAGRCGVRPRPLTPRG